ncbi:MAG: methylamine utilization protein [Pseudomonadota bacterium]
MMKARSMRFASALLRLSLTALTALTAAVCQTAFANGSIKEISVLSANGEPVPGVVVALEPLDQNADMAPAPGAMDQIDRQFVPHILVVQRGAEVRFPNSDSIKHHVFSFSAARTFEIRLFDDSQEESLDFPRAGSVELGCNVHDWMLGYIYVADTPHFTRTNRQGIAELTVPDGDYRVRIWHPRIQDDERLLLGSLSRNSSNYIHRLKEPLLPNYEQESVGELQDYD